MSNNTTKHFLEKVAIILIVLGSFLLITSIFAFTYHQSVFNTTQNVNSELFSNFGSFISGSVGSMWTLSSLLLFYLTLKNQKKEIDNNQDEVLNRMRLLEQQENQFLQERIESTIFNLISSHHMISNNISIKDPKNKMEIIKGRECFLKLFNIYKEYYNSTAETSINTERISNSYKIFSTFYQEALGSYFRNLYNIFKFIHNSKIEDKKLYTNLIRAQLSNYELLLLFYNSLSPVGSKFKFYVENYNLFDNLILENLLDESHKLLYHDVAFV